MYWADIARHVVGCHVTHETRFQNALDDVVFNIYLALSEGDRLSGICVDVYGEGKLAVAAVSSAWVDFHRADVVRALGEQGVSKVVWRIDDKMLALELGGRKRAEDDDELSGVMAHAKVGTGRYCPRHRHAF